MNKCWLTFILLCHAIICNSKEFKETLCFADGTSCIDITYDLQYEDDKVRILFKRINKNLNPSFKYKSKDIDVVFFEKIGVYDDVKFIGEVEVRAFKLSSNLSFDGTNSIGYFLLSRRPELPFILSGDDDTNLSVPMYIVKKKKEKEYKLLEELGELKIKLCKPKAKNFIQQQKAIEKANIIVDNGSGDEKVLSDQVYDQIKIIEESLENQTELPFTEVLNSQIKALIDYKTDVKGKDLRSAIDDCLKLCASKEVELREDAVEQKKRELEEAKKQQEELQKKEYARQDSIKKAEQTQAETEKKQNLWMIIGGAILAVLCFIGNQIFQHFRNLRSQKNMLEMQEDIARRAEYEVKRHTQNAVRKKTNEVVNNTKKTTDKLVRDKLNKSRGNNSTKFSI